MGICASFSSDSYLSQLSIGGDMQFNLDNHEDASVLHIGGELDALSVPELRPVISRIGADRPSKVLVELSELRMIDSLGVGTIIALLKTVRAYHGSLSVVGVRDQPLAILRLLRLDRVLSGDVA
jgi:anti-sigma B factor antagonist